MYFRLRAITILLVFLGVIPMAGCQLGRTFRPVSSRVMENREIRREGISALEKQDYAEAELKLSQAVAKNERAEDMPDLRRHYSEALWHQGKLDESLAQLYLAIKEEKNDPALYHSLADKLLAVNEVDAALYSAERSIDLAPKQYKSWALRAKSQQLMGDRRLEQRNFDLASTLYKAALSDYHHALALCGSDTDANRALLPEIAKIQHSLGLPERELATWESLQRHYPPNGEPLELLVRKAEAYFTLNRYEDAADTYAQARGKDSLRDEDARQLAEAENNARSRAYR